MSMLFNYLGKYIMFWLIGATFYIPFRIISLKKSGRLFFQSREIALLFFFSFIFATLSQTIFPDFAIALMPSELSISIYYPRFYINISNIDCKYYFYKSINTSMNLVPIKTIWAYFSNATTSFERVRAVINIIGNVCLFIPIGFLFPIVSKKVSLKRFSIFILILILAIEVVQFYVGRSADVDDMILNSCGALLGYMIFNLITILFRKKGLRNEEN